MARIDTPVIIEAAINGGATKAANPNVPMSPDEHVADIVAVIEAGAAIVHHHDVLAPTDRAPRLAEVAGAVIRRVLDQRPDALCYPATVFGGPIEERLAHHRLLTEAGVLRVAFCDPGSTNLGTVPRGRPPGRDARSGCRAARPPPMRGLHCGHADQGERRAVRIVLDAGALSLVELDAVL